MNQHGTHTAILIFSRTAPSEARAKKMLRDARRQTRLSALMIEQTVRIVEATGLPYRFFSEKHQVGHDFGERLTHAFRSIFAQGYDNVICVGNDCLSLRPSDLLAAQEALETHSDVVLGQATDGGVYLMGCRRDAFEADWVNGVAWQTPSVFATLTAIFAARQARVFTLAVRSDADTLSDLVAAMPALTPQLREALRSLLAEAPTMRASHKDANFTALYTYHVALRAPPTRPL